MAIDSGPDVHEPAPARFRVNAVLLYVCAALGGFIAAIADIAQKDEASAVTKLTRLSAKSLNATLEPHVILLTVVVLAALLCMVFQPKNRTSAFAVGLGTIAVVMTGTPYSPPKTGAPRPVPEADTMWRGGGLE